MKRDNWQYFSVKRFPCKDIFLSVHFCFYTGQMKMKKEKKITFYIALICIWVKNVALLDISRAIVIAAPSSFFCPNLPIFVCVNV